MNSKEQLSTLVIGTSGSGKSYITKHLILQILAVCPKRSVYVVNAQKEEGWEHLQWEKIHEVSNAVIIFEDVLCLDTKKQMYLTKALNVDARYRNNIIFCIIHQILHTGITALLPFFRYAIIPYHLSNVNSFNQLLLHCHFSKTLREKAMNGFQLQCLNTERGYVIFNKKLLKTCTVSDFLIDMTHTNEISAITDTSKKDKLIHFTYFFKDLPGSLEQVEAIYNYIFPSLDVEISNSGYFTIETANQTYKLNVLHYLEMILSDDVIIPPSYQAFHEHIMHQYAVPDSIIVNPQLKILKRRQIK